DLHVGHVGERLDLELRENVEPDQHESDGQDQGGDAARDGEIDQAFEHGRSKPATSVLSKGRASDFFRARTGGVARERRQFLGVPCKKEMRPRERGSVATLRLCSRATAESWTRSRSRCTTA